MVGLKVAGILRGRLKRHVAPRQAGSHVGDGLVYPCDAGAAET